MFKPVKNGEIQGQMGKIWRDGEILKRWGNIEEMGDLEKIKKQQEMVVISCCL